jgi:cytochrome d ubiquinol oxidase subunit II
LVFVFTTYVVLDGRNFGAGALHLIVTKTAAERRQVVAAIGPLWSWHEVWLVALGGVLFVAFPRFLATAFSGYYLALYLVLWSLILRGVSLEVGGHIDNRLWQGFWDFVFTVSNIPLAVLFGTALGNEARGVSLDSNGEFHLALFTDFQVRGPYWSA